MASSIIELIAAVILIMSQVIQVLIAIITSIITLVVAICFGKGDRVRTWFLKLQRRVSSMLVTTLILATVTMGTQWTAYTPPILDSNGNAAQNSIAALDKVMLGGSSQWISIRGKNKNNPVLLFLAGGPGGSQMAATREQLKGLEEHFVVVSWDQPGAGKSYNAVPDKSLTPERYISDAHELTQYLCKRFNKEKIYVVGESWGSALGIWLVQRYPELFYAFVGTGQMVDFKETEIRDYELAIKIAQEKGDTKKVEKLKSQGQPPYYGSDVTWKGSTYLMYLSDYMTKNPEISRPGYNTLGDMAGPEYGLYDKVNYLRGVVTTFNRVYQQLYNLDLRKQSVKIDVPVYLLEGRHDINAPIALAEEYYNLLQAPSKKLIWFEHSGHSPWINERDKFVETMVNTVLKETGGK